jgi:hypothetical protein
VRLRCVICGGEQEAEHLAVACAGCGARGAMKMVSARAGLLQPGEPVCGPSRVPITRGRESEMRGPLEEPLEVTRARASIRRSLGERGLSAEAAEREAIKMVPIQCGLCGGTDDGCRVCLGRATAPTQRLLDERAGAGRRRGSRRAAKRPPGPVARVSE